jgi:hypothetical protein
MIFGPVLGLNHQSTAQAGRQRMARGHPRVYIMLIRTNMRVEIFHKSMTTTHFHRENKAKVCDGYTQALTGLAFHFRSETKRLNNVRQRFTHGLNRASSLTELRSQSIVLTNSSMQSRCYQNVARSVKATMMCPTCDNVA